MVVTFGGDLVLTGVNWFIASPPDVSHQLSGTSFVSNYISEINAIVTGGGETLYCRALPFVK